jgi:hypothetical protein
MDLTACGEKLSTLMLSGYVTPVCDFGNMVLYLQGTLFVEEMLGGENALSKR